LRSNHGERTDGSATSSDRRGTSAIVAATAFAAVAVVVFHALGSRLLGPDGFAPIAVLWTLMFLLHTVLLFPAEQHLTRALVVTRTPSQIAKIRHEMILSFSLALLIGVVFTAVTLDRFFDGSPAYVAFIALIVVNRSIMVASRGVLAGHRRFLGYGVSMGLEALGYLVGGIVVALVDGNAIAFGVVMVLAPLVTLVSGPFRGTAGTEDRHLVDAQPGSFLAWLVLATGASQLIIAGGPIAVSFVGGSAAAVSVYFTSFALLRGPLTSAYALVARVLPDFTELAHGDDPGQLWKWAMRIVVGGLVAAALGALGAGLLLRPIVDAVYGAEFAPPVLAAVLGGAGVGLGLGALFATQVYSAAGLGRHLVFGWISGLVAALAILVLVPIDPVNRVALAFVAGEGVGLLMLGVVLPQRQKAVQSVPEVVT
jgi:O-antigen/teichoic acid export membrane protein